MLFTKSTVVEKWLESKGIGYSYEEIEPSTIDRKQSRQNRARQSGAIIQDHVFKLACDSEAGAVFPPGIAVRSGGLYRLLDGNHRDEANEMNGKSAFAVYVVETDDEAVIEMITRFANRDLNGEGQGKQEAIRHALYLHEKYKIPLKKVAVECGVSIATLKHHSRIDRIRKELLTHGIPSGKMSNSVVSEVGKLDSSTPVMVSAAEVAVRRNLTAEDAKWMAEYVCGKPKNDSERLVAVEEFEEKHLGRSKTPAGDKHTRAGVLLRKRIDTLNRHLTEFPTAEANAVTRDCDRTIMRQEVAGLADKLVAFKKSLGA